MTQPNLWDAPVASPALTVSPTAIQARRSGLRRARSLTGQCARYLAALADVGPATDATMSTVLGIPLASVCGRRNELGDRVVSVGRERVEFTTGRPTYRTLWACASGKIAERSSADNT